MRSERPPLTSTATAGDLWEWSGTGLTDDCRSRPRRDSKALQPLTVGREFKNNRRLLLSGGQETTAGYVRKGSCTYDRKLFFSDGVTKNHVWDGYARNQMALSTRQQIIVATAYLSGSVCGLLEFPLLSPLDARSF